MTGLLLSTLLLAAPPKPPPTSPRPSPPETGYRLTAEQAAAGWISLFDGSTTFGWREARVEDGLLVGGVSTTQFGEVELYAEVVHRGRLKLGEMEMAAAEGEFTLRTRGGEKAAVNLAGGLAVAALRVRPLGLRPQFNGRDLEGWRTIHHPRLAEAKRPEWTVQSGVIQVTGGPSALERQAKFGDFVLQIDVRTRRPLANGGVFVRAQPGRFLNGYEAQVFNACYDHDPARPARWSTGAIDDRQMARRLVSRDLHTFTMTVVADGPHLATWVNGYQMTDWTDTRAPHDNPREGLRIEPGTLQLQAHDPQTDVEFSKIRVAGR